MKEWLQEVITALDLDEVAAHVSDADLAAILDGARHAAHEVERPAAPGHHLPDGHGGCPRWQHSRDFNHD